MRGPARARRTPRGAQPSRRLAARLRPARGLRAPGLSGPGPASGFSQLAHADGRRAPRWKTAPRLPRGTARLGAGPSGTRSSSRRPGGRQDDADWWGGGARARTLLPAGDGGRRGWGGRSAWPPAEPSGRVPSDSRPRPPRSQAPPPPAPGRAGPGSHFGQSFVMVLGPQEAAGEAWPVSAAPTSVPRASRRFRPPLRRARRRLPALRSPIAGAAASERPGMGLPPGRDPSGGGGGGSGAAAGGSSALRAPPRARPRPFRRGGGSRAPGGLRAGLGGRRPGPSSALIVSCLGGKFAEPDTAPLAARRVTEGRGGRGRG